jgi:hypothetical protein
MRLADLLHQLIESDDPVPVIWEYLKSLWRPEEESVENACEILGGDEMGTTGIAQQIYEKSVKNLPAIERLRLVKLVMDDLTSGPMTWIVDESDLWTDEDYADLTRASLAYAARSSEEQVQ